MELTSRFRVQTTTATLPTDQFSSWVCFPRTYTRPSSRETPPKLVAIYRNTNGGLRPVQTQNNELGRTVFFFLNNGIDPDSVNLRRFRIVPSYRGPWFAKYMFASSDTESHGFGLHVWEQMLVKSTTTKNADSLRPCLVFKKISTVSITSNL